MLLHKVKCDACGKEYSYNGTDNPRIVFACARSDADFFRYVTDLCSDCQAAVRLALYNRYMDSGIKDCVMKKDIDSLIKEDLHWDFVPGGKI